MGAVPTREEFLRALAEKHGAERQRKLRAATVAVCGLGGLGSNVAIALARAGVGRLILIDFDWVRQAACWPTSGRNTSTVNPSPKPCWP